MEESKRVNIWKAALEGGIIIGVVQIIVGLILFLLDMQQGVVASIAGLVSLISILVVVQFRFRDNLNNGFISYGRAYGYVVVGSIYAGIILALYQLVFINLIDPNFMDNQLDKAYNDMIGQGYSESQIKMSMEYSKMFMTPGIMALFAFIGTVFMCSFLGLITSAAIMKKEPNRGY